MRRIIPVNQAKVNLTKYTSAIIIVPGESFISCNERADGRVFTVIWNIFSGSESTPALWAMTPTICPANMLISVSKIMPKRNHN